MEPETRTQKPRRSPFGCLFSGGLGCGAFLFGALASVALFAPTMLGEVVARWVQSGFHRNHDGRLMIEDLQLSWADRQRASGVTLLDREGDEVVVFNARFPPLLTLLGLRQGSRASEIEILRARIEIDGEGVSNLARALADRGRPFDWAAYVDTAWIRERPLEWQVGGAYVTGDWAWTSIAVEARAGVIQINDLRHALEPVSIEELHLAVLAGPSGRDEAAAGSGSAREDRAIVTAELRFADQGHARVDLSRPLDGLDWSGWAEGKDLPTRFVGSLLGDGRALDLLLGPHCDGGMQFASLAARTPEVRRVEGELSVASGSRIEWAFVVDGDELRPTEERPVLHVVAPEGSNLSSEATHWIFPWIDRASQGASTGGIEVTLERASLSRRVGLESLDALALVTLGGRQHAPIRAFAETLGLSRDLTFELQSAAPLALAVEDGVLRYENIAMAIAQQSCSFSGEHLLVDGRIEVEIEVPLSFVGRRLLDPGALEQLVVPGLTVPVQLVGPWQDPQLSVRVNVLQEAMSQNFKSTLRSATRDVLSKTIQALTPTSGD